MEKDIYYTLAVWILTIIYYKYDINEIENANELKSSEKYGCPNCNAEFLSHILVCSDCGKKLVNFHY